MKPYIYLCGHTGSMNRGCQAIASASTDILSSSGAENLQLLTYDAAYDRKLGLDRDIALLPYPKKSLFTRGINLLRKALLKDGSWGQTRLYDKLLAKENIAMTFCIGGDTYCYGTPNGNFALNLSTQKHGIPNVLWGCSVDERVLTDKKRLADMQRYRHIVARETLSYEILRQCVTPEQSLWLACDPAFRLRTESVALPEGFLPGNTLGLNLSPLVFSNSEDLQDPMYRSAAHLIGRILDQTDMNICLIPHVFDHKTSSQDLRVLKNLLSFFPNESRICILDGDFSCHQIKHVISHCRFFIGARTHATNSSQKYCANIPSFYKEIFFPARRST